MPLRLFSIMLIILGATNIFIQKVCQEEVEICEDRGNNCGNNVKEKNTLCLPNFGLMNV